MKREIHDLLHNLVDDSETIPEPEVEVSEASRQKVDAIVEKMNQEKSDSQSMPKPVYNKPPKRRRPLVKAPDPVSHFTEEPSQNPVVRMHDRLLEDALPSPDPEKKPVPKSESEIKKSKSKSKKKKNTAETSRPKKEFRIEIKEELPPDIPRDTTVADRLKQEQLEAVLAATPPKTPEQLRKEKIKRHAAEIKKQMKENKNKKPVPEPVPEVSEPEETIPEWEDALSEFSETAEKENSAQLEFLKKTEETEVPALSEIPDIPEHSGEDTALTEMSEELAGEVIKPKKKKKKKKKASDTEKSEKKPEKTEEKSEKKSEKKKTTGKFSSFFGNLFGQKPDVPEEDSENPEQKPRKNRVYQPPEKITEVLIAPGSVQNEEKKHNLSFAEHTGKETLAVTGVKKKKKTIVSRKKA